MNEQITAPKKDLRHKQNNNNDNNHFNTFELMNYSFKHITSYDDSKYSVKMSSRYRANILITPDDDDNDNARLTSDEQT